MTDGPIRERLWNDLVTTPLEDSPWLVAQYGDALRAVLDTCERNAAVDWGAKFMADEVRKAIRDAIGVTP